MWAGVAMLDRSEAASDKWLTSHPERGSVSSTFMALHLPLQGRRPTHTPADTVALGATFATWRSRVQRDLSRAPVWKATEPQLFKIQPPGSGTPTRFSKGTVSGVGVYHPGVSDRRQPFRALAALSLVGLALMFTALRTPILRSAGWLLVAEEPIQKADIIVVAPDTGGAGVLEAADLVHGGIASTVAVFAGPPDDIDR